MCSRKAEPRRTTPRENYSSSGNGGHPHPRPGHRTAHVSPPEGLGASVHGQVFITPIERTSVSKVISATQSLRVEGYA